MNRTATIDKEITNCLPQLNQRQKKTLLHVAKSLIHDQEDWWDEISKEQQKAIDYALKEVKAGKLTPHDDVMKTYKKWMKK